MGLKKDPNGYSLAQAASAKVAERVRALLSGRRMTQAQVARTAGIQPPHLSELLKADGSRNFQRWHVQALAKAIGVQEQDLVGQLVPQAALAADQSPVERQEHVEATGGLTAQEFLERQDRHRQLAKILHARFSNERLPLEEWSRIIDEIEALFEPRGGR